MSNLAFLGAGNMAAAIISGLIARDATARTRLSCLGGSGSTARALSERTGIRLAQSLPDLTADADVLVVAFKPQHLAGADPRLAELTRGKLVVSVLAGKTLASLAATFPNARNVVRTMPNTPAAIGLGMTAYCAQQPLSAADRAVVDKLLGACGEYVEVEETLMDAVTAISGCGPAFVFEFTAALREAGVSVGLSRDIAARLASQTVLGAAQLLHQRQTDPEVLRNEVTSPNGATMAGLRRLEAGHFRELLRETAFAARDRAAELSRG